ncbi:hypothetical protein FOMPIDRAFT_88877 [Fomitopsis schrenkii]|uniref:Uncharacterized protein n=1 Tax=Fomitopsis schrenkii TaxID=2126942 RepID=S8EUR2_FOMSC|nr:hypothetical protein FOMPIDRAFT_88877 [Fomitopsis schrenkii]
MGCYSVYRFEYTPGFEDALSTNKASWTINVASLGADSRVEISALPVSQESAL